MRSPRSAQLLIAASCCPSLRTSASRPQLQLQSARLSDTGDLSWSPLPSSSCRFCRPATSCSQSGPSSGSGCSTYPRPDSASPSSWGSTRPSVGGPVPPTARGRAARTPSLMVSPLCAAVTRRCMRHPSSAPKTPHPAARMVRCTMPMAHSPHSTIDTSSWRARPWWRLPFERCFVCECGSQMRHCLSMTATYSQPPVRPSSIWGSRTCSARSGMLPLQLSCDVHTQIH
mmetsp:Transcript_12324/g.34903  ORF Transcript_12324/g.34903 Transcript_12324/m.34903 type:complete len:229 (+) Transcript_12324:509-1195(+)